MTYNHKKIERKWQKYWQKKGIYKTKDLSKKPKFYCLDMFPYPSGYGLHVGHFKGYVVTDVFSRVKRMEGFNVLHPMGWDAFGLPAENYALKTGIHPAITTKKNILKIKKQMEKAGFSYDWSREINTTDSKYYKWTQWIFLKLFEKGLAYEAVLPINWCPSCKTGLANEEVVNGKCDRCGAEVTKKDLKQWVLKITAYADRLLKDLDEIDWPEKIKEMQRNWIGRSEGWAIKFNTTSKTKKQIEVFTTRIDTLFGCTYLVLSPEHNLIEELKEEIENFEEVKNYIEKAKSKTEKERISEQKEKTGVEIKGIKAINPINEKEIPIFVADYVLVYYGTGAIMAVPAHDQRDFDFAKKFNLPIIKVIEPLNKETKKEQKISSIENITKLEIEKAYEAEGVLINSGNFNKILSKTAREKIGEYLAQKGLAKKSVCYKLRDWIFSRQRYWGEPIPIVHCPKCGVVPLSEKELPLKLPKIKKYQPSGTGDSPLATIEKWVNTKCPKCKGKAKRETNTMPQWAGSCWYYLRYIDSKNQKVFVSSKKESYWMPVDLYVGGAEHAVLHLLYARFWHKFLYDLKLVSTKEPFLKLRNVGLVLSFDGQKMSKSKGNVISPDEIIKKYGADTLRVYEMFMGPFEQAIFWSNEGIKGVFRFLNKVWTFILEYIKESKNKNVKSSFRAIKEVHKLNKKVDEDVRSMKFNTAISAFMEFLNFALQNKKEVGRDTIERFLVLFAPFSPHLTEELWHKMGYKSSIHSQKWPNYDANLIKDEKKIFIIQVNGKLRDKVEIKSGISKEEAEKLAFSREKIKKWMEGKKIRKTIFVPERLINLILE